MELFASAERKITLDVIQNELTIDVYPKLYKMAHAVSTDVARWFSNCRLQREVFRRCDALETVCVQLWVMIAFPHWFF